DSKSPPPPPNTFLPKLTNALQPVAADQAALNDRLRALDSSSTGLGGVATAGDALQHDVLIAQGRVSTVTPNGQGQRATLRSYRNALVEEAAYAAAVQAMPASSSSLTKRAVDRVHRTAQDAEAAFTVLSGTAPSLPSVPVGSEDALV